MASKIAFETLIYANSITIDYGPGFYRIFFEYCLSFINQTLIECKHLIQLWKRDFLLIREVEQKTKILE